MGRGGLRDARRLPPSQCDRHDALRSDDAAGGQAGLVPRADAKELTPTAAFAADAFNGYSATIR